MTLAAETRFRWREHSSPAVLAGALASHVATVLAAAIADRGHAALAVSGGTTPVLFFRALSSAPLDWQKVTVTLVDERFVSPDSPRSNERLVRENLLRGEAAAARFVSFVLPVMTSPPAPPHEAAANAPSTACGGPPPPLRRGGFPVAAGRGADPPPFTGEGDHAKRGGGGIRNSPPQKGEGGSPASAPPSPLSRGVSGGGAAAVSGGATSDKTPEAAARILSATLENLPLPFDLVVLGMGTDGHTASFFPDAEGLQAILNPAATRLVLPVHAASAGEPRLTLSLPAIVSARNLVLHIEGEAKRAAFETAMDPATAPAKPVRVVVEAAATPPTVFWAPSEGSQP